MLRLLARISAALWRPDVGVAKAVGAGALLLAGSPWGLCHRRAEVEPLADDPLWVVREIARKSLEPQSLANGRVDRARYRDAPIYIFSPPCCDQYGVVYDERGKFLDSFGGLPGRSSRIIGEATGDVVLWEPSDWSAADAQAVLQSGRLRSSGFLRAFAQLELDTGIPWTATWPDPPDDGPPGYIRVEEQPRILVNPATTAQQAAMEFLTRYKKLFDLEDPGSQMYPASDAEAVSACPFHQGQIQLRRVGNHHPENGGDLCMVLDDRRQVVEVSDNWRILAARRQ